MDSEIDQGKVLNPKIDCDINSGKVLRKSGIMEQKLEQDKTTIPPAMLVAASRLESAAVTFQLCLLSCLKQTLHWGFGPSEP